MHLLKHRAEDTPLFPAAGPRDPILTGGKQTGDEGRWLSIALMVLPAACALVTSMAAGRMDSREAAGAVVWISAGLAMLVTSTGLALMLRHGRRDRRERVARSVRTTGVVTGIDIDGIKGDISYRETPVVRFTTAGGHELEVRSDRPRSKLSKGDTVGVRYDPHDSAWMMVTDGERGDLAGLLGAFGAFTVFNLWMIGVGVARLVAA